MKKLIYGKGINDVEQVTFNGKLEPEYVKWTSMLRRCYNEKHPTYIGCSIDTNWLTYSRFKQDYISMIGCGLGWQLDKDLLIKGNKVYSKDNCVMLPSRINLLLINRKNDRGSYPVGVRLHSCGKYEARCNIDASRQKSLGLYSTPEEAFRVYKVFKESYIKQIANEYVDTLDPRAYNALMNYVIEIND